MVDGRVLLGDAPDLGRVGRGRGKQREQPVAPLAHFLAADLHHVAVTCPAVVGRDDSELGYQLTGTHHGPLYRRDTLRVLLEPTSTDALWPQEATQSPSFSTRSSSCFS